MTERALIELLYGSGAHANTLACVEDLPLEFVGRRADNFPHSIWQLVNHMNFWMANELKRIGNEKPVYPAHASESWPTNGAPSSEGGLARSYHSFPRSPCRASEASRLVTRSSLGGGRRYASRPHEAVLFTAGRFVANPCPQQLSHQTGCHAASHFRCMA